MKQARRLKAVFAGVVVALSLVIPIALIAGAGAAIPTLYFDGMRLKVHSDGSVQMLLDVAVEGVNTWAGVSFKLDYDPQLIAPSDFDTNVKVQTGIVTDAYFRLDPELYDPDEGSPIDETPGTYTSSVSADGQIFMQMNLKQTGTLTMAGSKLELFEPPDLEDDRKFYVVNTTDTRNDLEANPVDNPHTGGAAHGKTVIGTLSFRVAAEDVPGIVARYGGIVEDDDPVGTDGSYFIFFPQTGGVVTELSWEIYYYTDAGTKYQYSPWHRQPDDYSTYQECEALFTFEFPEEIIMVDPIEKDVAVNAYHAYSSGTASDIPLTLQKFGPMVTLTYASGRRENVIMPWGSAADEADYKALLHDGSAIGTYDPTGKINLAAAPDPTNDYLITQHYTWEASDGDGGTEIRAFPVPVEVTLEVQEIHLLGFTSERLYGTFPLNQDLPTLTAGALGLDLPDFARVVTDIPPGNTSLLMPIPGWSSANANSTSKWPAASNMDDLYADGSTGGVFWPLMEHLSPPLTAANHAGVYSFDMAESNGGAATDFKEADVRARFPWLSIPADGNAVYKMPQARRVLDEAAVLNEAFMYDATYISTTQSGYETPVLTLEVSNAGDDIDPGAEFRILLPDGSEIGTGLSYTDIPGGTSVTLPDWFDTSVFAAYTATHNSTATPYKTFTLTLDPGRALGNYADARELLRRAINLGGYFYVSVNEDPTTQYWSDYIPVYVPPRDNLHLEDVEYNFIGINAGMYQYPGAMGKTVTLPQGTYHPVDDAANPYYVTVGGGKTTDPDDTAGVVGLYEERYGVLTTYDGLTGAEPGRLHTFTVEGTAGIWPHSTPVEYATAPSKVYTLYGADRFQDGRVYGAYGMVKNPTMPFPRDATIRLEEARPAAVTSESLKVSYAGSSSAVAPNASGVLTAKYDNRTVGYTDRQEYELTLENTGDTDLYDIAIINATIDAAIGSGHFIITKPPATFLPAGGKTTFTVTYVYGLAPNDPTQPAPFEAEYLNHFYVTSSSRPPEGLNTADPATYLDAFDAVFSVKSSAQHRIIFDITPPGGEMGDAGIIIGEENLSGTFSMNFDPGSNRATGGDKIFFEIRKADPAYAVQTLEIKDAAGNTITPTVYPTTGDGTTAAEIDDDKIIYSFEMPNYDVTITIVFSEPLVSKVRLADGWVWASPDNISAGDPSTTMEKYALYQKTFTAAEDTTKKAGNGTLQNTDLMTKGRAADKGMDPQVYQYLTVVPYEAEYVQVEVLLRQVLALVTGNNPLTGVYVAMTGYQSDGSTPITGTGVSTTPPGQFYVTTTGMTNPTIPPSVDGFDHHLSNVIEGPDPDKSIYVEIIVRATTTLEGTKENYYYIEIHRAPETPRYKNNYGNSPHGLIMNAKDSDIPAADKADALAAFVANRFSFQGLDSAEIPNALDDKFLGVHYWSEAWVKRGALYEPETRTGISPTDPIVYDPAVYDPSFNLDLNEHALFIQVGEAFDEPGLLELYDSSGRPVDLDPDEELISCSAEVTLLDTNPTPTPAASDAIIARFSMPDPAVPTNAGVIAQRTALLELGLQGKTGTTNWWNTNVKVQKLDTLGDPEFDADGNKVYEPAPASFFLRPGVYELVYTYTDFDGEGLLTVTRPLVVLLPVGDVNGTHAADGTDRTDLRYRVGTPLAFDDTVTFFDHTNLYKYRVCDVNNDRNINNIDANQLNASPRTAYYQFTGYRPT